MREREHRNAADLYPTDFGDASQIGGQGSAGHCPEGSG